MTPFDMLFGAVLAVLALVVIVEYLMLRAMARDDEHEYEPWIQVWPPDDGP